MSMKQLYYNKNGKEMTFVVSLIPLMVYFFMVLAYDSLIPEHYMLFDIFFQTTILLLFCSGFVFCIYKKIILYLELRDNKNDTSENILYYVFWKPYANSILMNTFDLVTKEECENINIDKPTIRNDNQCCHGYFYPHFYPSYYYHHYSPSRASTKENSDKKENRSIISTILIGAFLVSFCILLIAGSFIVGNILCNMICIVGIYIVKAYKKILFI